jgi:16S rRNA (cytosine967-C5)-methyltransferase
MASEAGRAWRTIKAKIGPEYMSDSPRQTAISLITQWLETQVFPEQLLADVSEHRPVIYEMVYGTVRRCRALQWIIARYAKKQPEAPIEAALLVGLYQLLHMDSVPDHAAINETVRAVKSGKDRHAAAFVNGLLRNAQRNRTQLEQALQQQPVGIRQSHPDLLIERWTHRYGPEKTEALCEWNNQIPDLVIHVNALQTNLPDLATRMQSAGIDAVPHPAAPQDSLVIPHGIRVEDLPGYQEGHFTVCDPATAAAVALLAAQPGDRVLDACAAPGGKTMLIAQQMQDRGSIVAADISTHRLARVEQNADRLDLHCITPVTANACDANALKELTKDGLFDRILLDVPCTNTGVLRRRVDARWRFSNDLLSGALNVQRSILNAAIQVLAPKGTLVYSTCSLEQEEGADLLKAWLQTQGTLRITEEKIVLPPDSGTDGIYAARLERA